MKTILIILLLCSSGFTSSIREEKRYECDFIEINRVHSADTGKHQYDQAIFWVWCPEYRRYIVLGWTLLGDNRNGLEKRNGKWEIPVENYKGKAIMSGRFIQHSSTTEDRERENQKFFDEKFRKHLTGWENKL